MYFFVANSFSLTEFLPALFYSFYNFCWTYWRVTLLSSVVFIELYGSHNSFFAKVQKIMTNNKMLFIILLFVIHILSCAILRHILGCASSPIFLRSSFGEDSY